MPKIKESNYKSALAYLFKFINPHIKLYFTATIIALILVGINLYQTKVTAELIDSSIAGDKAKILVMFYLFSFIIVVNFILKYINGITITKLSVNVSKDLKNNLCRILLNAEYKELMKRKAGDILSSMNSDVAIVHDFISGNFTDLFAQFVMAFGTFVYLLFVNPMLCLVTFLYTPIGMYFTMTINKKMNVLYPKAADENGEAISVLEQTFSCIPIIKSFVMEKRMKQRILTKLENVYGVQMKIGVYNALMQTACSSTSYIPRIIFMLYAGNLVMNGNITIGMFIAVYDLLNYIIGPSVYFPFLLNGLNQSIASMNRLKKLDEITITKDFNNKILLKEKTLNKEIMPSININNISFEYEDGLQIINNFSFEHKGKGIIAICGESGCGKTTLFDLICGLYLPKNGSISTHGGVSIVSQEAYLFQDTVMENIRIAHNNSSDEDVVGAAEKAEADVFIRNLPKEYDTLLGDGNTELSGGQKQRISLARIMLQNTKIWILDEPTSALDSETEELILKVLKMVSKEKLIFISAHKQSVIDVADKVVYMEGVEA